MPSGASVWPSLTPSLEGQVVTTCWFVQMKRSDRDVYVNILVAGESGQGKTTCIENLFACYHPGTKFDVHDGSATSLQVRHWQCIETEVLTVCAAHRAPYCASAVSSC